MAMGGVVFVCAAAPVIHREKDVRSHLERDLSKSKVASSFDSTEFSTVKSWYWLYVLITLLSVSMATRVLDSFVRAAKVWAVSSLI